MKVSEPPTPTTLESGSGNCKGSVFHLKDKHNGSIVVTQAECWIATVLHICK